MIFLQFNNRLLPVGRPTITKLVSTKLAFAILGPDFLDLHLKQFFDRTLHIKLRCFAMNLESVLVIASCPVHTLRTRGAMKILKLNAAPAGGCIVSSEVTSSLCLHHSVSAAASPPAPAKVPFLILSNASNTSIRLASIPTGHSTPEQAAQKHP